MFERQTFAHCEHSNATARRAAGWHLAQCASERDACALAAGQCCPGRASPRGVPRRHVGNVLVQTAGGQHAQIVPLVHGPAQQNIRPVRQTTSRVSWRILQSGEACCETHAEKD